MLDKYYKISDILFIFNDKTELKFNSVLYYTTNEGVINYFHKEYTFNKNNLSTVSVKRYPSFYLSIENKELDLFLMLKSGDFYQFKATIFSILKENKLSLSLQLQSGNFMEIIKSNNQVFIKFNNYTLSLDSFELLNFISIIDSINLLELWNYHVQYVSSSNYIGSEFLKFKPIDTSDNKSIVETKSKFKTSTYNNRKKSFFD